jgi:pseudouridine kinase
LKQSVVVVGAAAVDILGAPEAHALIYKDAVPGRVHLALGGVARNIAENLARLGVSTELISALGDDFFASLIREQAEGLGISLASCLEYPNERSATFIAINELDGDLALAIADMAIIERITPADLDKHASLLNSATAIVLETDLSQEIIEYLATQYRHIPLFGDPVSVAKAGRLTQVISHFHTLKPNQYEAEYLTGTFIQDQASLDHALDYFLNHGVKQVFITLGKHGVYYGNPTERGFMQAPPVTPINTLGAGDAFLAACVEGFLKKRTLIETTHRAQLAAYWTLQGLHTVNPTLSTDRIDTLQAQMLPQILSEVPYLHTPTIR